MCFRILSQHNVLLPLIGIVIRWLFFVTVNKKRSIGALLFSWFRSIGAHLHNLRKQTFGLMYFKWIISQNYDYVTHVRSATFRQASGWIFSKSVPTLRVKFIRLQIIFSFLNRKNEYCTELYFLLLVFR